MRAFALNGGVKQTSAKALRGSLGDGVGLAREASVHQAPLPVTRLWQADVGDVDEQQPLEGEVGGDLVRSAAAGDRKVGANVVGKRNLAWHGGWGSSLERFSLIVMVVVNYVLLAV